MITPTRPGTPMPTPMPIPTGTVTFLFTDIEGSTRMWEAHARAMQAAVAHHDAILREAIESNQGYIFKTMGDAFCAAFPTAPHALEAAIAAQRALNTTQWEDTGPIKVRMALHTGVAEVRDNDYFGLPLNRVARLLSAGYGEQILLSLATQQLVRDHLPHGASLRDLGEGGLKDLVKAEHVYQVISPDLPSDFPPLKSLDTLYVEPGEAGQTHNPYKGLRAFQQADAPDFFGREALTERLLKRLAEQGPLTRFLAVVGPSGSGKSSVVRAGVIPALRAGKMPGLPGSDRWLVVEMLPGPRPLEELEAVLLRVAVNPPEHLISQLREDERGLCRAIKRVLPSDESVELILVIDQFEEVFTLVEDEADRVHFLESLCAAVSDPRNRVRVIVTLRADFYDRPLLYPDPGELIRQRTEVMLPLTAEELERAIVNPAQRVGISLEPELLSAMIKDVGEQPGSLPLLQYALTELFDKRKGKTMTLQAYRANGGVTGALARRADELYEGLTVEEQEAARQLFLRLITLGEGTEDTRRRVRRAELASISVNRGNTQRLDRVLDLYGRYRLLTFDMDPVTKGPTVEVAHEALIKTWGRLREWLDDSRSDLRVQRQLMVEATEWARSERDTSYLASGARLGQFEALAEGADSPGGVALTQEEKEYLGASVGEQERQEKAEQERQEKELELARQAAEKAEQAAQAAQQAARAQRSAASRLRYLLAGAVAFLAVASILAFWAVSQSQVAQANFEHSEAQRLAASANTLLADVQNPSLIALLALRSNNIEHTPQGEAALDGAMGLAFPLRVLSGHSAFVSNMVASPDGIGAGGQQWLGKYVATTSPDKTARVWDVQAGNEVQRFEHSDTATGVAFSPDGTKLLTGCADGITRLWDIRTGKEIREFKGHTAAVQAVNFSNDGKYILTGSDDKTARLWDAATGREMRQFVGHTAGVGEVAFLPGDKLIRTVSYLEQPLRTYRIWDVQTGKELRQFPSVTGFRPSAGNQFMYLAAQSDNDQTTVIWDTETDKRLASLPTGNTGPAATYLSADGKTLLVGAQASEVQMWDTTTGHKTRDFTGLTSVAFTVGLSPNGKTVAAGDGNGAVMLWDAQSGRQLRRYAGDTGAVRGLIFSSDGRTLLTMSDDNTMRLWETEALLGLPRFVGHTGGVEAAAFSPDGKLIATGSVDSTAMLWNALTGEYIRAFTGHTSVVNGLSFSRDGKRLFTAGFDHTARLWGVDTGKQLLQIDRPSLVLQVAMSHSGRYGILGLGAESAGKWDPNAMAAVYDLQSGNPPTPVYTLTVGAGNQSGIIVYGVDFSPDDKYVLTGSYDDIARLWDMSTGKLVSEFKGHTNIISGAVFSPDGKYILTGSADKTARLWDLQTGQEVRRFVGHSDGVNGVAFSHDGKYVVTASMDRTARIWDAATGKELRRLTGHSAAIWSAQFSPDDKTVVTASDDATARLWYTDYRDDVSYLCGQLQGQDFTDEERTAYEIKDTRPTCPKP